MVIKVTGNTWKANVYKGMYKKRVNTNARHLENVKNHLNMDE